MVILVVMLVMLVVYGDKGEMLPFPRYRLGLVVRPLALAIQIFRFSMI